MMFEGTFLPDAWSASLWRDAGWTLVVAVLGLGWIRAGKPKVSWLALAWVAVVIAGVGLAWVMGFRPGYALGLSFQAPSLLLVALCVASTLKFGPKDAVFGLRLCLIVAVSSLGLLVSVLSFLAHDVYAWGIHRWAGPAIFSGAIALVGWRSQDAVVLALVAVVFELTRWPTGNAWDALTDPWLALWALWRGLSHIWRVRTV
jgi:hypothetical protein